MFAIPYFKNFYDIWGDPKAEIYALVVNKMHVNSSIIKMSCFEVIQIYKANFVCMYVWDSIARD